jgi:hypothetical protein
MLLQNNNNHNFLSNQTLGGLPAGFGNLGDPANTKDFSAYAGDQFFSIDLSPVHLLASGSAIRFKTSGLTLETAYKVQESTTLTGFSDVAGSEFTATNSAKVVTLPVTPGTDPKKFFRIRSVAP